MKNLFLLISFMCVISVHGQTLVWDWSNEYLLSESSMAIGISESSIDQITVLYMVLPFLRFIIFSPLPYSFIIPIYNSEPIR